MIYFAAKMPVPEKITFRLGSLAGPLGDWCDKYGKSPSEAARIALSLMLEIEPPKMQRGNPEASRDTALEANKARWIKKKQ